jgi:hypothetical protein
MPLSQVTNQRVVGCFQTRNEETERAADPGHPRGVLRPGSTTGGSATDTCPEGSYQIVPIAEPDFCQSRAGGAR